MVGLHEWSIMTSKTKMVTGGSMITLVILIVPKETSRSVYPSSPRV